MTDILNWMRNIFTSASSHPGLNSRIRDLCSDGAAEIERLREILRALIDADEHGGGVRFSEVMDAVHEAVATPRVTRCSDAGPARGEVVPHTSLTAVDIEAIRSLCRAGHTIDAIARLSTNRPAVAH
jgi:hypothetical protein